MDREQRRFRSRSPFDGNDESRDSSLNRNSRQTRGNRSLSPRGKRMRGPASRMVYVANIPYECKWTAIKDLFKEKVGDVSYVDFFQDENGKFRGCGIVEFKDASSVQKAVEVMHRHDFNGRQLVVKEDFDVARDKTGKIIRGGRRGERGDFGRGPGGMGGGTGGSGDPQYNTFGLSPQFLDSLGISGPLMSRIFVANLDYKVTPQKLEEVFTLAGKVMKIDLKKDEEGNSKGHGTIEMGNPVEAVQAISMFNGQKLFNRTMSVRMDKHKDDGDDKHLPEGLQSVGKGLGANGLPLHLSNANPAVGGLTSPGMPAATCIPNAVPNNFGAMRNNPLVAAGALAAGGTGVAGLGGITMGLGLGGDRRNFGTGVGVNLVGEQLGLANPAAASGDTVAQMLGGGLNPMANAGAGLNPLAGGLGNSMTGSIGLGVAGLGTAGVCSVAGYNGYDKTYDRGADYRNSRNSGSGGVRNGTYGSRR